MIEAEQGAPGQEGKEPGCGREGCGADHGTDPGAATQGGEERLFLFRAPMILVTKS